jgi:phytoene desaturase
MRDLVFKPGQSVSELLDMRLLADVLRLDVFRSVKNHVNRYFRHPFLRQLMEFPVLFLGALPAKIPALYSLMNYADIRGGTWYPEGGMYSIVKAMHALAEELGVRFHFNHAVSSISIEKDAVARVGVTPGMQDNRGVQYLEADVVIGGADYHHIETQLLPKDARSYTDAYWDSRVMSPACLIFYVGVEKRINNLLHHSLFFDTSIETHGREIYETKAWPADPLFYVSATSVTDDAVAPPGHENLFFLIPVASGLTTHSEALTEKYFSRVMDRFERHLGQTVKEHIVFKKTFAPGDFAREYNAYKGNAYGLANTLRQTSLLKPSCRSKKVRNLFYTGQLTVPGPGVPPSLISGEIVAKEVVKNYG